MVTKSIVLSQLPEFKTTGKLIRGVAKFSGDNNLSGELHVWNIPEFIKKLKMIVKIGNKSFVIDGVSTPDNFEFKLENAPISDNISVLLADHTENCIVGVASGSCGEKIDLSPLFEELSEKEIDELLKDENLEELKTLANQNLETRTDPPIEQTNFYETIKPQLDELFARFPRFTAFEERVPNSEWVKVNFSDDEAQHYLLGKLCKNGEVTHIIYAIPAQSRNISPPQNLVNLVQWMPLNVDKPDGAGYWVMYQDSSDGENIIL